MTEAKPLSKERRAEIEAMFGQPPTAWPVHAYVSAFVDLVAAERYWREKVRDLDIHDGCLCGADGVYLRARGPSEHKPDCSWLKAQEE